MNIFKKASDCANSVAIKVISTMNSGGEQKPQSKAARRAKKLLSVATVCAIMTVMCTVNVFAEGGGGDLSFFTTAVDVLQTVVLLIGAGVGVWGVINLLEGYGNDNPGAKSQGMKQLMAGIGVALVGILLVPSLKDLMSTST